MVTLMVMLMSLFMLMVMLMLVPTIMFTEESSNGISDCAKLVVGGAGGVVMHLYYVGLFVVCLHCS